MHPLEILSWALNEKSSILDQSEASPHFDESSAGYIHSATSENTRKAYQSDIDHFLKWGGVLPTSPSQLIHYFTEQAPLKNPRTLKRRQQLGFIWPNGYILRTVFWDLSRLT
jgi:hypothetical protein